MGSPAARISDRILVPDFIYQIYQNKVNTVGSKFNSSLGVNLIFSQDFGLSPLRIFPTSYHRDA